MFINIPRLRCDRADDTDTLQAADIIKAANSGNYPGTQESADLPSPLYEHAPSPTFTPPPSPVETTLVVMTTFVTVYI